MNVPEQIARAVALYPDRLAAVCGEERCTFVALDARATSLGRGLLECGLNKGDRVATLLENSIRCIEVDFALAKTGLVRVSINPRSSGKDICFILADSDARVLIFGAGHAVAVSEAIAEARSVETFIRVEESKLDPPSPTQALDYEALVSSTSPRLAAVKLDPEELYCLLYTSGTTGRPKGVMLSHRSILQTTTNLLLDVGPQRTGEKILLTQPLSHGSGFFVLPWLIRGCTSVIMRRFDALEVLRLTGEHSIETVKLIPTMLQRILRVGGAYPLEFPRLRQIVYGASPLPAEVLRDAVAKFGNKFVQIYGQSEAPMAITSMSIDDHASAAEHIARLSSAGRPWSTVELRVIRRDGSDVATGEAGELIVRAPQMMSGYWKLPEATSAVIKDGWLHTKDMASLDEQGYVYLLGRSDEMIISGGYNIAPREVEDALYLHPAVQEAAVIGEPDAEWGQAVVAYVALRDDHTTSEELLEFSKAKLGFKRPKRVYRVSELPKNANGKIQKTALRASMRLPEGLRRDH